MTRHTKRFFLFLLCAVGAFGVVTAVVYAGCGACGSGKSAAAAATVPAEKAQAEISTAALAALVRAKVPAVILDARTSKWDDGRRIPGAKTLTAQDAVSKVRSLAPNKDALIVTYCGSVKCPLSHALAHRLEGLGYTNVVEYGAGIAGWAKAGHPVETVAVSTKRASCAAAGGKSCCGTCK